MGIIFYRISILSGSALILGILLSCTTTEKQSVYRPHKQQLSTQKIINRTLQKALEFKLSGVTETSNASASLVVKITPKETWKSKSGHYCRSYFQETRIKENNQKVIQGIACRDDDGRWKKIKTI